MVGTPGMMGPVTDIAHAPRFPKYDVLARLGAGGLAEVYLGQSTDPAMPGLFALKRLRDKWRGRKDLEQLFVTEADVGRLLRHPNIVLTHGVGYDEGGALFLVMEYVAGKSLAAVLNQIGSDKLVAHELSLHIVCQLLSGLHFAHELRGSTGMSLNLVHRDVTPDNIFVSFAGEVKLSDFGIAHVNALDGSAENRGAFGKIPYMSPEQLLEKAVDRRSDLHAAGVILYQLLTGTHPFGAASDEKKMIQRVVNGKYRPLRRVIPRIPKQLEAVVDRALAPKPEQRFNSAFEMVEALFPFHRYQVYWGPVVGGMVQNLFPEDLNAYHRILGSLVP